MHSCVALRFAIGYDFFFSRNENNKFLQVREGSRAMSTSKKSSAPHQQRRKKGDSGFNKGGEFVKRQKPDTKVGGKNQAASENGGPTPGSPHSSSAVNRPEKNGSHHGELDERTNYIVLNLVVNC